MLKIHLKEKTNFLFKFLVGFEIKKCKAGYFVDDDEHCEPYLRISDGLNVCSLLNSTMFGFHNVINNFVPIPKCPLQKGVYIGSKIPNLQGLMK